jgi:hypothetical protein
VNQKHGEAVGESDAYRSGVILRLLLLTELSVPGLTFDPDAVE